MRFVEVDCDLEAGEECKGCGRKTKAKMRERSGCKGGRQTQIMETFASMEDQTAASAFLSASS